jgi:hypothetical protein
MSAEIEVLFVVGFGPIVRDVKANLTLFRDTLGVRLHRALLQPKASPLDIGLSQPERF